MSFVRVRLGQICKQGVVGSSPIVSTNSIQSRIGGHHLGGLASIVHFKLHRDGSPGDSEARLPRLSSESPAVT